MGDTTARSLYELIRGKGMRKADAIDRLKQVEFGDNISITTGQKTVDGTYQGYGMDKLFIKTDKVEKFISFASIREIKTGGIV